MVLTHSHAVVLQVSLGKFVTLTLMNVIVSTRLTSPKVFLFQPSPKEFDTRSPGTNTAHEEGDYLKIAHIIYIRLSVLNVLTSVVGYWSNTGFFSLP